MVEVAGGAKSLTRGITGPEFKFTKNNPRSGGKCAARNQRRQNQEKDVMRSDKVFQALHTLTNRYMLCQLASKATRRFHRPNTRIPETMNEVLDRIASSKPEQVTAEMPSATEAQRRAA